MTALEFTPVFRTDVYVICPPGLVTQFPEGTKWQISREYCLSDKSADELCQVLADLRLTVVQRQPMGSWYRFSVSGTVAHFLFPAGNMINAADLAMWWVRMDPNNAERMARIEAAVAVEEFLRATS